MARRLNAPRGTILLWFKDGHDGPSAPCRYLGQRRASNGAALGSPGVPHEQTPAQALSSIRWGAGLRAAQIKMPLQTALTVRKALRGFCSRQMRKVLLMKC